MMDKFDPNILACNISSMINSNQLSSFVPDQMIMCV